MEDKSGAKTSVRLGRLCGVDLWGFQLSFVGDMSEVAEDNRGRVHWRYRIRGGWRCGGNLLLRFAIDHSCDTAGWMHRRPQAFAPADREGREKRDF